MSEPLVVVASPAPQEPPTPQLDGNAAVEIAAIQAARDVEIATLEADVVSDDVAELEEDVEWLRTELASLHAGCDRLHLETVELRTALETALSQISLLAATLTTLTEAQTAMALSIPPQPSEPLPSLSVEDGPKEGLESPPPPEPPPLEPGQEKRRRKYL